jgi:hypothetical protein
MRLSQCEEQTSVSDLPAAQIEHGAIAAFYNYLAAGGRERENLVVSAFLSADPP